MNKVLRRLFLFALLSFFVLLGANDEVFAQCSLCKSSAESSLKEGNTQAKGLNTGILYLLVMPYLLVGGIGYWWYVQKKKSRADEDSGENV